MRERNGSANGLLVFLIYGMFAMFSLFLVVIGAKVYRDVVDSGDGNTQIRSSFTYISNKIRMSSGNPEDVRLEEREGIPVLRLTSNLDAGEYETLIYYYDGAIRESYGSVGQAFAPEMGDTIVEANGFSIEETDDGQLLLTAEDPDGSLRSMHLEYLVSEKE